MNRTLAKRTRTKSEGGWKPRRWILALLSLAVLGPPGLAGIAVAQVLPDTCIVLGDCPSGPTPTCSPQDSACNHGEICSFASFNSMVACFGSTLEVPPPLLVEGGMPGVRGLVLTGTPIPGQAAPDQAAPEEASASSSTRLQYYCSFTITDRTRACWSGAGARIWTDGHFFAWCNQAPNQPCMGTTTPTSGTKDMWPNANYNGRPLWCINLIGGSPDNTCDARWTHVTSIAVNDAKNWAEGWARGGTQGWTN